VTASRLRWRTAPFFGGRYWDVPADPYGFYYGGKNGSAATLLAAMEAICERICWKKTLTPQYDDEHSDDWPLPPAEGSPFYRPQ
jgi:hypothetical protein